MDEEPTERLWVRIKGRAGTCDIIVGVCYRPPDQEDRADEGLYRQIGAALVHVPWSSWGTSTIPISVGGTTQQGISNPGGSWSALMITSSSK